MALLLDAGITAAAVAATSMTLGMAWPLGRGRSGRELEARQAASVSLAALLERCEDAVALTDPELRVWYANGAFASLAGRTIAPDAGTTIAEALVHRIVDSEGFARVVDELKTHAEQESTGELTHLGTPARAFEWRSIPMRHEDGGIGARAFVFHDRSQAHELAGLKSDFLSTVTHELRTPLTSVKGSLQLVLGKSSALSPVDCELLNISLKNADRLIRLINDLLDISRLELGKIELVFAKVSTASLVEEAVAGLRPYAGARQVAIEAEIDADVPALEGDRDRLIQVLTNLISNAVKFSPTGGRVVVRASGSDQDVAIAVRDWGIGIRAADQDRLFRRFQRLNPGYSDEPGTGLGLAISKAIVDRHGGRVIVASRENEGSTFTVLIPAIVEAEDAVLAARGSDVAGTSPRTILLVDDDEELGTALKAAWGDRYRVVQVARGMAALDVARISRPDVVLLDVVLPDLSGYDVLRILRQTSATSRIPIVMLTVQPERPLATNLGAVDVVGKPVDLDRLTGAVERALAEAGDQGLSAAVGDGAAS